MGKVRKAISDINLDVRIKITNMGEMIEIESLDEDGWILEELLNYILFI